MIQRIFEGIGRLINIIGNGDKVNNVAVVCIAGMHRSGTSMLTKLLQVCGLYLGEEDELMPPNSFNPVGYWENTEFVAINDALLSHYHGAWDLPTPPGESFDLRQVPEHLSERARKLLEGFEGRTFWGWKDPRNSLTLSFWRQLIPELKIIICLRNPLDVARSLGNRDHFPAGFSFDLWHAYNQRVLNTARPEQRLISKYEVYFINPQDELKRVLKFVGLPESKETIQSACVAVMPSLRHSQNTTENLIAEGAPSRVSELYAKMCLEAGSV